MTEALEGKQLVAIDGGGRSATVLSRSGAAPARLSLARFHAPRTCGPVALVTELVLAFPPGGASGRSAPPSHVSVVALLEDTPFAGGPGVTLPPLGTRDAMSLIRRVAERAEGATRGPTLGLLHPPSLNADQAADAGEVVPLRSRYAVGFRATFVHSSSESTIDTTLITGVAVTDSSLHDLHWVVRPVRLKLVHGLIARGNRQPAMRYSLQGAIAGSGGDAVLLVDEIADVSPRSSRATAVDAGTRRVIAAQPLALRCP